MAYNVNHGTNVHLVPNGQLVDVSAASISYSAVPFQGVLIDAWACISAAVTGSDTVVTIKKLVSAANAVTLGTITIAVSGSAPGSTFQAVFTGSEINRTFSTGDTLVFDSDGVSSTTSIANFFGVIKGA